MPAPTVEMGLGGVWAAVAASHVPDGYLICAMRAYRVWAIGWETRAALLMPTFAAASEWLRPTLPYAQVAAESVNLPSYLPGGGLAISLNGVDDFLTVTTGTAALLNPFSLELLVSIDAVPSPGVEPLLFGTTDFGLEYRSDGRCYVMYNGAAIADAAVSTGTIHHLVVTRSAAATDVITLYLNGAQVDTASLARVSLTSSEWRLGANMVFTEYLDGALYGCAIHGAALSLAMVQASYASLSWTDVTADTKGIVPLVIERGIRDDSPASRVASTGTLTFAMNNLANNSGGVTGYYSPGHASCRAGFTKGAPVRVQEGGDTVFFGRVRSIGPTPGKTGGNLSTVLATDYMDTAATSLMENASVMEDVRGNEVFTNVLGFAPSSPNGVLTYEGTEVYPLALDNTRDEAVTVLQEFHRLAVSELGYIYVTRQGVLVYEARGTRVFNAPTATVTLTNTMHGLDVAEVSASTLNRVQVTVHPREVDTAATTVLFALTSAAQIEPGETKTIMGPYRTAASPGITTRVGGIQMVTPVATTDYTMNVASDGTGVDLTASLGIVANFGANGVQLVLTNNAPETAYITKLQCRGKGVYDFRTVVVRAQNAAAIAADGVNALTLNMVYQEDFNVGQALADLLLRGYGDLRGTRARLVDLLPDDPGLTANLHQKDISDRIALAETVTGATGEYYINGVRLEYKADALTRLSWWLTPAEPVSYWTLGLAGASELGDTTILGAA